jgi:endonuclease G
LIQRTVEALDYSDNLGEPNWASWNLTASDIGTNTRSSFITDTNLPPNFYWVKSSDYTGSGYDRGHLCPSKDRTDFATNNDLVFFMSNIMPQDPTNNSGVWATFEGYCRLLVQSADNYELLIICGPSGFTGARINTNGPVFIPDYVWKIVVVVPPGSDMATNRITATNRVIALKIPNTNEATNSWKFYITSANQIQADTGLTFFTALPVDVAAALRAKVDGPTNILAGWDTSGLTNYGVSPLPATTNAANLSVSGLTRGSGIKTNGSAAFGGWGGVGFTNITAAAAVDADQVATFTITASNGYKVSFSSISRFDYRRSGTGPPNGVLQFQIASGAFTNISNLSYPSDSTAGASIGAIDLSGIAALQNVSTNVTFRIVNYGGGPSGTWYLYDTLGTTAPDFAIQGTVTQVLTPALAPTLSLLSFTNHQFRLTVTGSAGTNYVVQAATNLAGPVWIPVATNLAPFQFIESNAVFFQQRFYRATTAP